MAKAIHLQKPHTQRTVISEDQTMRFYLDEQNRLLIKADTIAYPFPLDNVTTLALANMLHMFYNDIAASAKPYNGIKHAGRHDDRWE